MGGGVVVVGSLNCDLVLEVDALPRRGETVRARSFATFVGGKGANQAIAAARAGGRVAMIGRVGDDAFGARLLAALDGAGVERSAVRAVTSLGTGVAAIAVDARGDNSIVVAPEANGALGEEEVRAEAGRFVGCAVVLAQLEVPVPAVTAAFGEARRRGALTILNPAPAPASALPPALLAATDLIVPNETELAALAGSGACASEAELVAAAGALLAATAGVAPGLRVLVTAGARGAFLVDGRGLALHVPSPAVTVVDTTAAGDAFCGALATALAEGTPLEGAVRFACAAGAAACTIRGAEPSLPARATIERLLAGPRDRAGQEPG